MTDLFRNRSDFEATIDAAALRLEVDAAIVEKDYWVSQVLGALARSHSSDFIFKGGTSLSKGYAIIERFSEDVDILVVPGDRGVSSRETLMKAMAASAARVAEAVLGQAVNAEKGKHRTYDIAYPRHRPAGWLTAEVRLEMGVRGGPSPNSLRPISSLLADALSAADVSVEAYADLAPFEILVLHPARTLIEKLALVNSLAERCSADPSIRFPSRHGRHFYDIFKLLAHEPTLELLADREQFEGIVADCERVSREEFESEYERPHGGYAEGAAIVADADVSNDLRRAYEQAEELYFGTEPYPTWERVIERIRANAPML